MMTRFTFHPLLFAILPVLSMFAANPGQRSGHELRDSLIIVVGACAVLLLLAAAIYRDLRKAALAVSVLLLVWWVQVDDGNIGAWLRQWRYVMPLTYVGVLAWAVWLYRRRAPLTGWTGFANWASVGAILPPLLTLAVVGGHSGQASAANPAITAGSITTKPDIYYLVFDRYGDAATTTAFGGADYIGDYLAAKGFYVPRASRSNYMKTVLSLASSLNAGYLDEVLRGREEKTDWAPVYQHVWRHRVGAFLRSQGYSYTHLGSWYYPTRENPQATQNVNYYTTVPRAVLRLFDSQAFSPVQRALGPWLDDRLQNWHRVRRQVEDVEKLAPTPGPKFVFLHVLVPHPPYVFDRNGGYVSKAEERKRSFAENYANQVQAANAMIRRMVDAILKNSAAPPVIIVQGDEGPYPPGTGRESFDWRTATHTQLLQKTGILNAYYLPGVDTSALYPTISPVNSFRVVFNSYFGSNLPLLPDRTMRHISDLQPFMFEDITGQLTMMARSDVNAQ
jgi:hypothetical protein